MCAASTMRGKLLPLYSCALFACKSFMDIGGCGCCWALFGLALSSWLLVYTALLFYF